MSKFLREECKKLKVFQNISYKELADFLEIKPNSFYSWLKGEYEFSQEKQTLLSEIINYLKET